MYFPFPPFPPTLFFPLTRDPSSSSEVLQAAVLSVGPPCFPGGLIFTVVSPGRGPDDRILVISDAHAAAIQRHASTEGKHSNLYSVHADSTQPLTRIPRLISRSYTRPRFPLRKRNNTRSVSSSRQRLPPAFGFRFPRSPKGNKGSLLRPSCPAILQADPHFSLAQDRPPTVDTASDHWLEDSDMIMHDLVDGNLTPIWTPSSTNSWRSESERRHEMIPEVPSLRAMAPSIKKDS
jgi:hypothetical protein